MKYLDGDQFVVGDNNLSKKKKKRKTMFFVFCLRLDEVRSLNFLLIIRIQKTLPAGY